MGIVLNKLDERKVQCPFCGEVIDILIDYSVPYQNYIEDCQVCCQPISFDVTVDAESEPSIIVYNDNE